MSETRRGVIVPEVYTISCGWHADGCQDKDSLAERTKANAESEARRRGWRKSRAHGWICPVCCPEARGPGRRYTRLKEAGNQPN